MFYSKSTGGFYAPELSGDNIPGDAVEISREEHAHLLDGQSSGLCIVGDADGYPALQDYPAETPAETIARYEAALDNHLDSVARSYRYRDRVTFALRSGYPGPYQAEGAAFGSWMDLCNEQAYSLLGRVKAGLDAMPSIDAFIASLPEFSKP